MKSSQTSSSGSTSSESVPGLPKHWRELSDELTRRFQGFDRMLERLLNWSSGDSRGVPADSLPPSDSAAA